MPVEGVKYLMTLGESNPTYMPSTLCLLMVVCLDSAVGTHT